ncbi:ATP-binding protein [Caldibacillus lycopersici]|uniref:histidine kinase n=1 Tax=Perspicuibacillus lycopersici TaxID=1325689 RepID=A0AAE3LLU9_9BACI|nr:PAS domain-containing sensor histidine kinase [Perspicuibacillus lycopersici]MCU9612296.1 ATP-binding protein [Perspicuibacillus lycopersici]
MNYSINVIELKDKINELEAENKRLEVELQFFQRIYNIAPEPMILLDRKKQFVGANVAACQFFQTDLDVLLTKTLYDYLYLNPVELIERQDNLIQEQGTLTDEWLIELNDGIVKHIEFYALSDILPNTDIFIIKDITSTKRLEWECSLHLEVFNKFFNQIIDGVIIFDENGKIINVNPAFSNSVGVSRDELVTLQLSTLVNENWTNEYEKFWNELVSTGSFLGEIQLNGERETKIFEMSASANVYNGLYLSILRDITDKREIELNLQKSEEKFRNVFHGSLDGMLLWKSETPLDIRNETESTPLPISIVDINVVGRKILNVYETNVQQQMMQITTEEKYGNQNFVHFIEQTLKYGDNQDIVDIQLQDQSIKSLEFYSKKDIIPGVNLTIFRDITYRLQMENQLRKSEMLNVVGELAAGIAHEIRNPMTSLKGFIQLLRSSIDGYEMYFNIIMAELDRIEVIVNEFLVLAKPQAIQYQDYNVVQIMEDTIDLLHAQALMDNIQFEKHFTEPMINCYCEPNQIKQVFINIVKNAIEVMGNGGTIKVSMDETVDDYLRISIHDQGQGIPEEKLHILGQPFYTTKEQGTGLGLMVSYKIMKEHGGRIDVESEIGKGTVFHILLPLKRKEE